MITRGALSLALALMLTATGCSSGESAEAYFSSLETVAGTLASELDDLEGEFNAGLLGIDFSVPGSEEALIDVFQKAITGTADAFADFVAGIDLLEPPADLEAPHADALRAGLRVREEYSRRVEELTATASLDDIAGFAEAVSAARRRYTESCRELQTIAEAESIDVDLGC